MPRHLPNPLASARITLQTRAKRLTTCPPTAHSPIPRILHVTPNVPHARIVQALALVLATIHVLNAPETACCDSGGLRAGWHRHGLRGRVRHCGEGTEEFGQKGHGKIGEEDQNEGGEELQVGRFGQLWCGLDLCLCDFGRFRRWGEMDRGDDDIERGTYKSRALW